MRYIEKLRKALGREPTFVELQAFGITWSEHCGYCHTKEYIKRLPGVSRELNAGIVRLGGGYVAAFKVESHNHPSAVEPYNGAATGVGGIIRDILAMGVRPTAILDSLHMSEINQGIISGISDYGNSIGVPTVGGELRICDEYKHNPLVNVMAVGVGKEEHLLPSRATSPEEVIVIFGAPTGRDGIGGASFASRELQEEEEKIHIQVGDPFMEKLLIEAFLKMNEEGLLSGAQDLGAGGVLSATSELMSKGNLGGNVYLDRVPLREPDMEGWEILISESQERMAVVARRDKVKRILEIAREFSLYGSVIAELNETGIYRAIYKGKTILKVPVKLLTEAPSEPAVEYEPSPIPSFGETRIFFKDADAHEVFEQYDYMVGTDTIIPPGSGPALMRIKGTKIGYIIAITSRADLADIDPYWGAYIAVMEAARKIYSLGGEPLGITNGVNYGDPDIDPLGLAGTMMGLKRGAEDLKIPVVSGNASLYNTFKGKGIPPTLVIGMLGKVENVEKVPIEFKPSRVYVMGWESFDPKREKLLHRAIRYCVNQGFRVYSSSRLVTETFKKTLSRAGLSLEIWGYPRVEKAHQMVLVFADEPLETIAPPVVEVGKIC